MGALTRKYRHHIYRRKSVNCSQACVNQAYAVTAGQIGNLEALMADVKWCKVSSLLQEDVWVKSVCCAMLVWAAGSASPAHAQPAGVCRVIENADVQPGANGSTWAAAMTLDDALAASRCAEIWVRHGTYKPTIITQPDMSVPERSKAFVIGRPLKLYGGFMGTESALNARVLDPARPTVLSGDQLDNDLPYQPENKAYDDSRADNSLQVLVIGGVDLQGNGRYTPQNTVVDGLTITSGHATGDAVWTIGDYAAAFGGGAFCNGKGAGNVCSPTLSNLIFTKNRARLGGALANLALDSGTSSPVLSHVVFYKNHGANSGTVMVNRAGGSGAVSNPVISHTRFLEETAGMDSLILNQATGGASIHLSVRDSIFEENFFSNGAITSACTFSNLIVSSVTVTGERLSFTKNESLYAGMSSSYASPDCKLTSNFKDMNFSHNKIRGDGALIYIFGDGDAETNITNATVHGNEISNAMGHITPLTPSLVALRNWGSQAVSNNLRVTLTNVTVTDNKFADPGGVLFYSVFEHLFSDDVPDFSTGTHSIAVRGSILWGNTIPGGLYGGNKTEGLTIEHSLVQGGAPGAGNVDVSPELGPLADNGGFSMTRMPSASSPAVGNGAHGGYACSDVAQSPGTDQRGVTRPQNGRCDMGAVERMVPTLSVSTSGAGTVSSVPAGIQACATAPTPAGTCTANFGDGTGAATSVTLTATASAGSRLIGWSGPAASACSASSSTCTVVMDTGRAITAHFAAAVSTPGGDVALELPGSQCVLSSGPSYSVTPATGLPAGYTEVGYGQIGFSATGCPHGGTVNVRLTLASNVPALAQLWKWNGSNWVRWPATISGNTVQFSVVDKVAAGGTFRGDADPVPGNITDPVVLLMPVALAPGAATAIPTLSQWGLLVMALLLAALAARQHQRVRQGARSRQR